MEINKNGIVTWITPASTHELRDRDPGRICFNSRTALPLNETQESQYTPELDGVCSSFC
jgi:hypothetical protein